MSEEISLDQFFGLREVIEVHPKEWMHDYTFTMINTEEALAAYVDRAIEAGHCALDLESTGLDARRTPQGTTVDRIVGYCMSHGTKEGVYVPVRHTKQGAVHNLDPEVAKKHIQRLVSECVCIYHNSKFDHEFLEGEGITLGGPKSFEDTLILSYMKDSAGKRHGLKHLSKVLLDKEMIEISELFDEKIKDYDFSLLDPSDAATLWYAGADGICTYELFRVFATHYAVPRLIWPTDEFGRPDRQGMQQRVVDLEPCGPGTPKSVLEEQAGVYHLEKACVPATRWMERNRPYIDLPYLTRVRREVALYTQEITEEIAEGFTSFGYPFTPAMVGKPIEIGKGLDFLQRHGLLKVTLQRTESSNQVQTSDDVIEALCDKVGDTFPFLKLIRTFRRLQKVEGTYLRPLQENTDGYQNEHLPRNPSHVLQDSTTRFDFRPFRVDTGRFAASKGNVDHGYSGLNVQSIPACYNRGKFASRRVLSRPEGPGRADAELFETFERVQGKDDFLIRLYDNHFVFDPLKNEERCVAKSCEGCPFEQQCERDQEPTIPEPGQPACANTKILSLESSVRPAIRAREGFVISAIDQSGVELRLAANLSGEPRWVNEFFRCSSCNHEFNEERHSTPVKAPPALCPQCGSDKIGDLHTLTTQIVYGDSVLQKPDFKLYRQNAKGANFSVLYGGGGSAVARATGVSREEGSEIKDKMLDGLPKLRDWIKGIHLECKRNKQVSTAVGRRLRLPDIDNHESWAQAKAERNAVNGIIQGSATGDLTKFAMWRVHDWLKANNMLDDCRLMICIHDELVFEIRKDKLDTLVPVIVEQMTELGRMLKWPVPLRCDVELGPTFDVIYNWAEFHPYNPRVKAPEPVPQLLWRYIDFEPGMWYVEDGQEIMPVPLLGDEVTEETEEDHEELSEDEIYGAAYMTYKNKKSQRQYKGGPIATFRLMGSALAPLDEEGEFQVMRQMRSICDFCLDQDNATHTLRLESWDGKPLLTQEVGWSVNPEALRILTAYLGIRGDLTTLS